MVLSKAFAAFSLCAPSVIIKYGDFFNTWNLPAHLTLGIDSGNTSRVDSVNFALLKANRSNEKANTISLKGAVMASDAFFPFPDSILIASKSGVKSIIQPGGSIKDKAVIKEVDEKKLSMVFTNKRSFTH